MRKAGRLEADAVCAPPARRVNRQGQLLEAEGER